MREVFRLLRLAAPYKYWMLLAAFLGFLTVGSGVGLLMTSAYIISKAALHPSIAELQVGIVGVRFFGISRGVFRYLERLIAHDTTFRLLVKFRTWFYSALEPLAPAGLSRQKRGDLLSRFIADIQSLEGFYVRVIAPPMVAVMVLVLMYLLFGLYDTRLATILLTFHVLAGLFSPMMTVQLSRKTGERIIRLRSQLNNLLIDDLQGLPELLLFNRRGKQEEKIRDINDRLTRLQKREKRIVVLHESIIGLLMNGAVLTILIYAIPLVRNGRISGVSLAVLALGIMASFEAFLPLPSMMETLKTGSAAARRLFEITDARLLINDPQQSVQETNYSLHFKNVTFSYPNSQRYIFNNLTMAIAEGSKVAIVGPSGCGKTTLINLLMRFWELNGGNIVIGTHPLRAIRQEDLARIFGVVAQDSYIFNGTIRYNLHIAKPDAADEELIRILDKVRLAEYLRTHKAGLDTWIGDQGLMLSGGERQKLALARILLRETPVLILDEINAHLDALSSKHLMEMIWNLGPHKTVIVITHHLSHLEPADVIFVLKEGTVIEKGTYRELVQSKGYFYRMLAAQNEKTLIEHL